MAVIMSAEGTAQCVVVVGGGGLMRPVETWMWMRCGCTLVFLGLKPGTSRFCGDVDGQVKTAPVKGRQAESVLGVSYHPNRSRCHHRRPGRRKERVALGKCTRLDFPFPLYYAMSGTLVPLLPNEATITSTIFSIHGLKISWWTIPGKL